MIRKCTSALVVAASMLLPMTALAQQAYTTHAVNMHAGPAKDYPLVAWLPSGAPVAVAGCLNGWHWCDVIAGPNRGWVYAGFLAYPYGGRNVPIIANGAVIGLPLITFSIGSYWDQYYRARPWYRNRQRWEHRPAPPRGRPVAQPRPIRGPGSRPAPGPRPPSTSNPQRRPEGQRPGPGTRPGPDRAKPQPDRSKPGPRPDASQS